MEQYIHDSTIFQILIVNHMCVSAVSWSSLQNLFYSETTLMSMLITENLKIEFDDLEPTCAVTNF